MTTAAHRAHYTVEEYLAFEEGSNAKHEYFEGQIYAMAGGAPEHAALASAFVIAVGPQLRSGRCRAYSSDLRVRIADTTLITYPDVAIICGPVSRDPEASSVVNNPTLVVEVLSPSTAEYDRTDKFDHYKKLVSFKQYVLVDPRERTVEVRTCSTRGDEWSVQVYREGDLAALASVGAELDVRELFATAAEPAS